MIVGSMGIAERRHPAEDTGRRDPSHESSPKGPLTDSNIAHVSNTAVTYTHNIITDSSVCHVISRPCNAAIAFCYLICCYATQARVQVLRQETTTHGEGGAYLELFTTFKCAIGADFLVDDDRSRWP